MQENGDSRTLCEIAERSGFSMSDLAFISGLEESTVYRLWDNTEWLDKVTGRSLQALIAAVPDLGGYVATYPVLVRQNKVIEELAAEGLELNEGIYGECISEGIPEQHLNTALEAAVLIMRGDAAQVCSYLARFWGADQDRALTSLFSTSIDSALLTDPTNLIAASVALAPHLTRKGYSFHTVIAQAVFAHYVGESAGALDIGQPRLIVDRQSAFTFRASVTGLLVNGDDKDLADQYHIIVRDTPVLRTMEEWSFPTFTRDTRPNSDFSLPRSLLLRNTAGEILSEINDERFSDAYIYYLASTYLPIALRRDPTFGLRASELVSALRYRMDHCHDAAIRAACESLAKRLSQTSSTH